MEKYYALKGKLIIWGISFFAIAILYQLYVGIFKRNDIDYAYGGIYLTIALLVIYVAVIQQYIVTRKVAASVFDIDIPEADRLLYNQFVEENKERFYKIKQSRGSYCYYNFASIKREFAIYKYNKKRNKTEVPVEQIDITKL